MTVPDRVQAPFGARTVPVTAHERYGAYTVLACADTAGPRPQAGQFYMLMAADRWGGGDGQRPFLPRAFSVLRAPAGSDGLRFLLEDVGPGTHRLCELRAGDELSLVGPLGVGFAPPRDRRRPLLVGGGVGIAPLAIWQDHLQLRPDVLLGFRDAPHAAGAELLHSARVATDDGSVGHHGLVTELLADALGRDAHVEVYACGPPPMLEAVRARCADAAVPAQLALESGMACGFGACFGCVVATTDGYIRLCVDGPVLDAARLETALTPGAGPLTAVDFCGIELASPIINASGTFDAIAARRAFGEQLRTRFPFAAFVSKTVTLAPRQGNPPPRLWEVPAGLMNSIGLPNKGLDGYLAHDLPELAQLPVPLIVNVMGFTRDEVAQLVTAFAARDEVAALELNVSCPNVETGMVMGADPGEVGQLLRVVRPLTDKPLIVKLTPNASDVPAVALAAAAEGASAVSLINTIRGMALSPRTGEPWLGGTTGGVSGPAVRAIALAQVYSVCSVLDIPVIAMGGVSTGARCPGTDQRWGNARGRWHRELPGSRSRFPNRRRTRLRGDKQPQSGAGPGEPTPVAVSRCYGRTKGPAKASNYPN